MPGPRGRVLAAWSSRSSLPSRRRPAPATGPSGWSPRPAGSHVHPTPSAVRPLSSGLSDFPLGELGPGGAGRPPEQGLPCPSPRSPAPQPERLPWSPPSPLPAPEGGWMLLSPRTPSSASRLASVPPGSRTGARASGRNCPAAPLGACPSCGLERASPASGRSEPSPRPRGGGCRPGGRWVSPLGWARGLAKVLAGPTGSALGGDGVSPALVPASSLRWPWGRVSPGGGCGPGAWAVGNLVLSCPPPPACSRTPGDARVWRPGAGGWWGCPPAGVGALDRLPRADVSPVPPGRLEPDSGRGVPASPACGCSQLERRGLPGRVVSLSRAGWVVTMRTAGFEVAGGGGTTASMHVPVCVERVRLGFYLK